MRTFSPETSANSGKFETLIALQNDQRWLFLHTWFSKFPRTTLPESYMGNFWISFFYPTSAPRRPPPPHTHTPLFWYKKCRYFLGICLWAELPLPPPFSSTLLLLLIGYGYCYVKVSFQRLGTSPPPIQTLIQTLIKNIKWNIFKQTRYVK